MKWTTCLSKSGFAAATLVMAITMAANAAPKGAVIERSPDVLRGLKMPAPRSTTPLILSPGVTAAAAPTVEEVGDPDSFGRNVTYLGLAQTQSVLVTGDCTGSDPAFERCVVANPAPAPTSFNESDLATITLPAKASKSLLCFTLTPSVQVGWFNFLASPATARFSATAVITIENPLLDDPTVIDPGTGLPFGGSMTVGLSTFHDAHTLQPGESDSKTLFMTRSCIAGIVNKRNLVEGYGFTENQAKEFFKKPMTLRFGARGTVALADFANYFYGFRLYGD